MYVSILASGRVRPSDMRENKLLGSIEDAGCLYR